MNLPQSAPKIYALLVAIDDYPSPVVPLQGCKRDIERIQTFIESNYPTCEILTLKDSEATRTNLISGIREHLGKAKARDTALLYYAGHGGYQRSAREFAEFFRSELEETLVCFDSRLKHGRDLADKELAILFDEIGKKEPHLVTIFDSCHSGGITRKPQFRIRSAEGREDYRNLSEYLDGYYANQTPGAIFIPETKMLKISASSSTQAAHESHNYGGIFTYHLLGVLNQSGTEISYAKLFQRVRKRLAMHHLDQNPEFEAHCDFDPYTKLFSGEPMDDREKLELYYEGKKWWIDRGAMDGLPTNRSLIIEVEDEKQTKHQCEVTAVGPEKSIVDCECLPTDRNKAFEASLINHIPKQIFIGFEGQDAYKNALQTLIDSSPFLGIAFLEEPAATSYGIHEQDGDLWIVEKETKTMIQGAGYNPEVSNEKNVNAIAFSIVQDLKKILRWERGVSLRNYSRSIDPHNFEFRFVESLPDGREVIHNEKYLEFEIGQNPSYRQKIKLKLQVRNQSGTPHYFSLYWYSREYGIITVRNELIHPGEQFTTLYGESPKHHFVLPDEYDQNTDVCQLIVSRERVDDFFISQQPFELGKLNFVKRHPTGLDQRSSLIRDWCVINRYIKLVRRES